MEFFVRKKRYGDSTGNTEIYKDDDYLWIKKTKVVGNKTFTYIVKTLKKGFFIFKDNHYSYRSIYISLGGIPNMLWKMHDDYTYASFNNALRNCPSLLYHFGADRSYFRDFYMHKEYNPFEYKQQYLLSATVDEIEYPNESYEEQILEKLTSHAVTILNDLNKIDSSHLEKEKESGSLWGAIITGLFIGFTTYLASEYSSDIISECELEPLDLDSDTMQDLGVDINAIDLCYTPEAFAGLEDQYNVSFNANENSDGFIRQGSISLERTVSGSTDSFAHYTKDGHDYVKVGSSYIQVDSGKTVTINNISYDTI